MGSYVLGFEEIDKTKLATVGGKGANLGEISRIDGIRVPEGFCVTTEAYRKIIEQTQEFDALLEQLSLLKAEDRERVSEISGKIRSAIERASIPKEIEEEVARYLIKAGDKNTYAVRSSATAEDLPTASFAGQQDTYLNIIGKESILKHISRCWASLFTDRAVVYRMQNGFDHNKVHLSVVIQKMVFPESSGIMFTADPVTSNRKVVSIDASFGLGEALVSGLVDADIYKVQEGEIVGKKISNKKLAIYSLKEGGTIEKQIEPKQQDKQTLTDEQILQLKKTGRSIEAYFGRPQDIEWCLYEGEFYIVQSRPITTLYPVPDVNDGKNHVYMSLGHQQMMTDTLKPLGMSIFRLWLNKLRATGMPPGELMVEAGGRIYIDVSHDIASPTGRKTFVKNGFGSVDVLMQKALYNLLKREDYIKSLPRGKSSMSMTGGAMGQVFSGLIQARKIERENDSRMIQNIMTNHDAKVRNLERSISEKTGVRLFDFILEDMDDTYKDIVLGGYSVGMVGFFASDWIAKNIKKCLGEDNVTDILSQSLPNNVTAEMGLELLDVADVFRQYPAVLTYLQSANDEDFFEELDKLDGGKVVSESLQNYLKKYGVRCPGEIDITRIRWAEKPTMLIPMIINNIKNFKPGSHYTIFEQKRLEAEQKEQEIISRLEKLPDGRKKAEKMKKKISVFRNFIGFREYPKYALMQHFYAYKQALKKEAAMLVQKNLIQEPEDIYYLTFGELRNVVSLNQLDYSIVEERKREYEVYEKLTPPRVMTSDGEIITGEYDTGNIPQGALIGVPVSSGVIEGRARIVLNLEDADIEEGDILVTAFTDPSWTPLFVSIKGLITEVGGMMTHGAVVAREYGLPAVVSVENATKLIKDGQKVRINGTKGYVEIL
ncbi:phosphoenolpyruvate synthase [Sedimentibacter hydroxybenzoicus DSM 7310]|uniref:Rifampicin phosphotransferase n=1 Tax=Sedimentibacter hydroxybenzoicus DSM 7310 TaxID=1123245 RepID=A0A974BI40_SEDHY|nr:phosphoenolpyruvate synthase [Sedimentibacter hydroxybenzoicus]NYB73619.1 phosphoenolpyruvate synthase [Sedimentibacter hydroxybenzoicus DSM 7310]